MAMHNEKVLISIIVPVYNEEENIDVFYQTVNITLAKLSDRYQFEIIFTDNHSTDKTFSLLEKLAAQDSRVKVLRFSRNFGYQRSIFTGYINARGAAAIQLDCDLQDPPEMLIDFIKHWENGYKVVYGIRRTRQEGKVITVTRKFFYRLIDLLSDVNLPHDAGDFRLVDKCIIEELKKFHDVNPYLRGAIASIGFAQVGIPYDRNKRAHGTSKFSLPQLMRLAFDGIVNYSIIPLRISTYTGIAVFLLTILGLIGYVVGRLFFGQLWPAGFTTITSLILVAIGLNALFLGIVGEYLGRIYQQLKMTSITIVEKRLPPIND